LYKSMNLSLEIELAESYKSPSQKARVLTENWVNQQMYCPNCGCHHLLKTPNNQPVADFYCPDCNEIFELKSKQETTFSRIVDGAYKTMLQRLNERGNPQLFLLRYDKYTWAVTDFFIVPKHFFVPAIIEKRKPLSPNARRANWVGCNIFLGGIPAAGKIFLIQNRRIESMAHVISQWQRTIFLREEMKLDAKGWLLDIMKCADNYGNGEFTLSDMYRFEGLLASKHPKNKHIKDKIRQQLQILRDKGYLTFIERGRYRLT
jgi:type II restriction enzyme